MSNVCSVGVCLVGLFNRGQIMFKVQCIDHIVLRIKDIEKMVSFYCDILGLTIEKQQPEIKLTQLRAGASIIDLIQKDDSPSGVERNLDHFCLRISPFDFQDLKEYFKKINITIYGYGTKYGAEGDGESFYLLDPENNEVELKAAKVNITN
jgi:catechol-2,3-dioxygenase